MTAADWIALLGIALPLAAKVAVDVAAFLAARKHTALANIVGMAGRQAASAARAIASLPPGANTASLERTLINNSTEAVLKEMDGSVAVVGASPNAVAKLVQGELDKVLTSPPAVALPVIVTPAR